ncbi:hypothetical protein [Legionella bozemanae]|uniref:hypothetical protein n=1 Tax=Legionella bozemanae TaxID=447 RepID=UPI00104158BF|nr:hypothetical protein [Legionella bozemanae]
MIKSEFWTSEQVMSCSPLARLMFIGLWNFADDNGIHPASYKKLKAEVFPYDDYTLEEIQSWISELIQQRLLHEYTAEGQAYWRVTGWNRHQKINKPTYRYPVEPCLTTPIKTIHDYPNSGQAVVTDNSRSTTQFIHEGLLKGSDQREKKEKRKEIDRCEVETSPMAVSEPNSFARQHIFEHWQKTMNYPRAKLDGKRQRIIIKALKLGYSIDDLKKAIDGCAKTPFNMRENDRRQVYDDISLILRDAEHIERFMSNADERDDNVGSIVNDDLMMGVI